MCYILFPLTHTHTHKFFFLKIILEINIFNYIWQTVGYHKVLTGLTQEMSRVKRGLLAKLWAMDYAV